MIEYRPIPDFPGYRVGSDGSVWSAWQRRSRGFGFGTRSLIGEVWLKLTPDIEKKTGYSCVRLRQGGKPKHMRVHVLALRAFVGPKPDGMMGCHADDDPANNAITNLRWDTQAGNSADAIRNGKLPGGEQASAAKLTAAAVTEIKRRFAAGEDPEPVAADFGITPSHVYAIARGRFWKRIKTPHDAACRERSRRPAPLTGGL